MDIQAEKQRLFNKLDAINSQPTMRVITFQSSDDHIDMEAIRKDAGNPDLKEDEIVDFGKMLIVADGPNKNRQEPTAEAQRAAVDRWVGVAVYDSGHKDRKAENQVARVYKAWIEDDNGRTVTYGRAYAIKAKCDKDHDKQKRMKNRQHREMSAGYGVTKSECSICKTDTAQYPCPTHCNLPEYYARDLEFTPDHVTFVGGDNAIDGAGLVTHSARQDVANSFDESLRLFVEDGKMFREWTTREFSKWYQANNPTVTPQDVDALTKKLTAREMVTFARIEHDRFKDVLPDGKQQLQAPPPADVTPQRSKEEIKQSLRKGI